MDYEEGEAEMDDPSLAPNEESKQGATAEGTGPMKEGCAHYRRACMKKCEECKEFFPCRFCHDDVKY
jgi:hypothetical protein